MSSLEDFLPEGKSELVTLLLEHLGQGGVPAEENSNLQYRVLVRDGRTIVVSRSGKYENENNILVNTFC